MLTFPDLSTHVTVVTGISSFFFYKITENFLDCSPNAKIKFHFLLAIHSLKHCSGEFGSQTCFTKGDQPFSSHGP